MLKLVGAAMVCGSAILLGWAGFFCAADIAAWITPDPRSLLGRFNDALGVSNAPTHDWIYLVAAAPFVAGLLALWVALEARHFVHLPRRSA